MLVFIDESGDPGFKVDKGASPIFVAAMVIFSDAEEASRARTVINSSRARALHKPEFKFSKCSNDIRDFFFEAIMRIDFEVRAIVVKKDVIYSPHLRSDKESFYQFFVKQMMRHDNDILQEARVIIDGSGDREFQKRLTSQIRQRIKLGAVKDVQLRDSKTDVLVQLADMCAGAIARSYRPDRLDKDRWRRMLGPKISDVWNFR